MANLIKPASIDDLATVERIVHDAYVKYVARMGRRPGPMLDDYSARISQRAVWVIEDGSATAGVLVLLPKANHLLLDNVAVAPTHQGRGFGRRLLEFAEAEAIRQGYREIRLYTHETMEEDRRLYATMGYEETGRGTEDGYERVFMSKSLRPSVFAISQTAHFHLICGSTGAGKSTYAAQVAEQVGGVVFSIDEWMAGLFWVDASRPFEETWVRERIERCMTQIWRTALQVAQRDVPCVLDLGFSQALSRSKFYSRIEEAGFVAQLHFLDLPADERWQRVMLRNESKSAPRQLPFEVTREMFDFVERMWEPPTDQEMERHKGIRIEIS